MELADEHDFPGGASPVRVLLADDEPLVRAGLRMILESSPRVTIIGEAGDGRAAVQACAALRPAVVLMDIRMPVLDGIEATRRIMAAPKPPRVVMLTAFDTEVFVADALDAGAHGFLLKNSPPREILAAIPSVMDDQMPFTPAVLRRVATMAARSNRGREPVDALADLSEREMQVAQKVAEALSNTEIADALFLSTATVKTYLNRIFEKTGCTSRVALALLVERARPMDPPRTRTPDAPRR